ncbi:hypothetical protein Rruber_03741 [Rhodococcus ruber]|uniref:hypothetical protein n=1 Tax=Rhodococcus ruber TaxID=1830 RepID=UPI00315CAABB
MANELIVEQARRAWQVLPPAADSRIRATADGKASVLTVAACELSTPVPVPASPYRALRSVSIRVAVNMNAQVTAWVVRCPAL